MRGRIALTSFLLATALITGVVAAQTAPPAQNPAAAPQAPPSRPQRTLNVGDPAPRMNVQWIKGGAPDFRDGKIHVVEFWATWCGPCRANMPHLSDLARKHRDTVVVSSINIWELGHAKDKTAPYKEEVISFVNHAGAMMDHPVGMDVDDFMANNWMTAAGHRGIPTAFIIDKRGTYIWSGNVHQLEPAIELALEGKLDAAATARLQAEMMPSFDRRNQIVKDARTALREGKLEEALRLAGEAEKGTASGPAAVASLTYAIHMKKNREEGQAHARALMKTFATAPYTLRELARTATQQGDPAMAVEMLEAAMRCSRPTDPVFQLDLAKAYAAIGDYARAVDSQEKALTGMNNPAIDEFKPHIEPETKRLQEYRASQSAAETPVPAQAQVPAPERKLSQGDPAPPLAAAEWVKGDPVPAFRKGHVYVLDFWATWCVPCREGMPHMSELARKYKGQASFIAMNVWERPRPDQSLRVMVDTFTRKMGRNLDMHVAFDPDESITRDWMRATNQGSIPAVFIVDRDGRFVWKGSSQGIEEPLAQIVAGTFDHEAFARQSSQRPEGGRNNEALNRAIMPTYQALTARDYPLALREYEKLVSADPAVTPVLARFHLRILAHVEPDAAYQMVLAAKGTKDEYELARSLSEEEGLEKRFYVYLAGFYKARAAIDPFALHHVALAQSRAGDTARAVRTQRQHLKEMRAPASPASVSYIERQEAVLKQYETALQERKSPPQSD